MRLPLLCTLLALCVLLPSARGEVVIAEFLASGDTASLIDEDGDRADWIELLNTGNQSVSLAGYSLSDDAQDPLKWIFQGGNLGPGERLVVLASGKDRQASGALLHTNFRLSASGEFLGLSDNSGDLIDSYSPEFPEQMEDVSYGRANDSEQQGFLSVTTPGSSNSGLQSGSVEDTVFSLRRGIYESGQTLTISTQTPDAVIRYTLDGSEPTLSNGDTFREALLIDQTTTVRARAYAQGLNPTNIDTHTYLFPADVVEQSPQSTIAKGWPSAPVNQQVFDYGMDPQIVSEEGASSVAASLRALPSVCLTLDQDDLTGAQVGIYVNASRKGRDWERRAHLEILSPDETPVSERCGLRIRGGFSRNAFFEKHSFRVFFREEYGAGKLRFPLFGREGAEEFDKIDFRTPQNYSWAEYGDARNNTFIRDVLARDLQRDAGQPYTRSRYYHLYLNGTYWGVYQTQERAEANYAESYFGGDADDYDVVKNSRDQANQTEATDGTTQGDWRLLWETAQELGVTKSPEEVYQRLQGLNASGERDLSLPVLLDVDNLIDYVMLVGWLGAFDTGLSAFLDAPNNWFGLRNREADDRGFSFFLHDAEHSLGLGGFWASQNDRINTTNGDRLRDQFNYFNPQFLHFELAENVPDYRRRFGDRAQELLFHGGLLTPDRVVSLVRNRQSEVAGGILAHSARWGDADRANPARRSDWEGAVERLEDEIRQRGPVFLSHLKEGQLYPEVDAPLVSGGQQIVDNSGRINLSGEGEIVYTLDGADPRSANGSSASSAFIVGAGVMESLIEKSAVWRYRDDGVNLGSSNVQEGNSLYTLDNWKHPEFNDNSWRSGPAVLGNGQLGDTQIEPISTTIGTSINGDNPLTVYLRKTFSVPNLSEEQVFTASALIDDAVIIYLNGQEVFRSSNLPSGEIDGNTAATDFVFGDDESTFRSFEISSDMFREGVNTFAVELHQQNINSSDLGFALTLERSSEATVDLPVGPVIFKARSRSGGEWSALTEIYFSPGDIPTRESLVVSEVHYHPLEPSGEEVSISTSKSDFEFIELTNISRGPLELIGTELTRRQAGDRLEGVVFKMREGAVLNSGETALIVGSFDAFRARYPEVPESVILGEFRGSLGNGGEFIRLQNRLGEEIANFRYDDSAPWPEAADGSGASLEQVLVGDDSRPEAPSSWVAGEVDGSPAAERYEFFDAVGGGDLLEFLLGEQKTPEITVQANGGAQLSLLRNREALGVRPVIEVSADLQSWERSEDANVERSLGGNGRIEELYTLPPGFRFARVRVFAN